MKRIAYGLAATFLAAALAGCTPSLNELRTQGISEYQKGHNDRAEELFQRVVDKHPVDADSWYYLGRIAHSQKKYERAIYCYQCAIDEDPGYEPAKVFLNKAKQDAGPEIGGRLDIIPPQREHILP